MSELLLEILSEEIPARMQARAAEDLARLLGEALKPAGLTLEGVRTLYGPRRIALIAELPAATPASEREEKGPRIGAPEKALEGFARKFALPEPAVAAMRAATGASDAPVYEGGGLTIIARAEKSGASFLLRLENPARSSAEVLAEAIPGLIRRFPWPKSMRWGTSDLIWVRPMQRILCLLDGAVVPFALAEGADEAHGLRSGDLTEGHRIQSPGTFAVASAAGYEAGLRERSVIPDAAERERMIETGIAELAAAEGLEVVPDRSLLTEVAGLVEWPVPLLGRIDDAFMDLPPELMRTTMRVNQRYFALRHPDGRAAARFALVANIAAKDGGAAIVGGNERVLRARLSDARFFWDLDRKQPLEAFLPRLDSVVFHAKLGTQGDRVRRLERLARHIAPQVGADPELAARAAQLAKADLASGMVGEFPELQGVMGRYYALHGGEDPRVAEAIGAHYRPLGPGDAVPSEPVAIAVALADKLDQLAGFFAADERPTGSGDPYALRRAALGVIRIIRENGLRLPLADAVAEAFFGYPMAQGTTATPEFGMAVATERMNAGWKPPAESAHPPMVAAFAQGVVEFLAERLRVQMRAEGLRHDLVAAAFGTSGDDDLNRLLARADALRDFLSTDEGTDLLAAYRRAANILRIEEKKDGRSYAPVIRPDLLRAPEEIALASALEAARPEVRAALGREDFAGAMGALAPLRAPVDAFFDRVTVNDPDRDLRENRLGLLALLRGAMDELADIARIEA
ncbi:glycine--tRNA ligase subunit beta [Roseomonas xinghualingensis]|uniref:glycine--tRNA ligase subunit beta n=1 Tax=Roseomonas xinghualingensis TaxID=2986475 RepID=UPI0021F20420|nr:glycine--tRNA ligase subunit beta [Roseomonas sp. SXEYE001]MCV4207895.1 glycine--tRNA ligase subunit beta [Roseomonas sp. SXEYE001]